MYKGKKFSTEVVHEAVDASTFTKICEAIKKQLAALGQLRPLYNKRRNLIAKLKQVTTTKKKMLIVKLCDQQHV
jgi:hypothetical protein